MREAEPILGINAVLGALTGPRRSLDRVLIERGRGGPRIHEIVTAARKAGIPVVEAPRDRLDRIARGARHQGVVGLAAAEVIQHIGARPAVSLKALAAQSGLAI